MHHCSFSWIGPGTSIKVWRVKLVLWAHISPPGEMMRSCKCFLHVSKMSAHVYKQTNIVIIKNTIILKIVHNILTKSLKIPKRQSESVYRRRIDNTIFIAKRKKDKRTNNDLQKKPIKLKIEQHEPH